MKYMKLFLKKLLRYVLKPLSFLPALVMMYVIFSFSAQEGVSSSAVSSTVSLRFVQVCGQVLDKEWSNAQVLHYAERGWKLLFVAGLFCVAFAGLDEWHQSFVPGRSPSPRDVLIDSIGIFAGIEITRLLCFIGRKTIFRPLSLENRPEEE